MLTTKRNAAQEECTWFLHYVTVRNIWRNHQRKPINRFQCKPKWENVQEINNSVKMEHKMNCKADVERISYAKQFRSNFLANSGGSWRRRWNGQWCGRKSQWYSALWYCFSIKCTLIRRVEFQTIPTAFKTTPSTLPTAWDIPVERERGIPWIWIKFGYFGELM